MIPEKTIGELIRQAREEKGLSQEEISRVTRLSLGVIRKLEQDRFAELPEGIYTQNYVRILGDYLGLDVPALLASLRERPAAGQSGTSRTQTWQVESVPEVRVATHGSRRYLWIVGLIVLIGLLLAAAVLTGRLSIQLGKDRAAGPQGRPVLSSLEPGPRKLPVISGSGGGPAAPPAADSSATAPPSALRLAFHPPQLAPAADSRNEVLTSIRRHLPDVPLQELRISARGASFVHVNIDDRHDVTRCFDERGGRWTLYAEEFFILTFMGGEQLSFRFNGEEVPPPSVPASPLVALRLDAGGARQGS